MLRNQIKKLLCLVLVIAMIASLSVAAFATDGAAYPMGQVQNCIVNMIKNVLDHEMILRELVRVPFRAAAAVGYALGLRTAAELLNHSLQDDPKDFIIKDSNSRYAQQIQNSAEFKTEFGTQGHSTPIEFKETLDLYLAYHEMSYTTNDDIITFEDEYDFAPMSWGDTLSLHSIIAAVNNFAYFAQEIGVIKNYPIIVTVDK